MGAGETPSSPVSNSTPPAKGASIGSPGSASPSLSEAWEQRLLLRTGGSELTNVARRSLPRQSAHSKMAALWQIKQVVSSARAGARRKTFTVQTYSLYVHSPRGHPCQCSSDFCVDLHFYPVSFASCLETPFAMSRCVSLLLLAFI